MRVQQLPLRGFGRKAHLRFDEKSPIQRGILDLAKLPKDFTPELVEVISAGYNEPFTGMTSDGVIHQGIFASQPGPGTRATAAVGAARRFLAALTDAERSRTLTAVDDFDRRHWLNAFPEWEPHGLWLDDVDEEKRELALALAATVLSEEGYRRSRAVMRINAVLGAIMGGGGTTLIEYGYWMTVYGVPSTSQPWGFRLMGHHLAMNVLIFGDQIVMTPHFMGAEPAYAPEESDEELRVLDAEREAGLDMIQSLSPVQVDRATLHPSIMTKDLPLDMRDPDEGRHRGGPGRDNAVVPFEGLPVRAMNEEQRDVLRALLGAFLERYPEDHRREWADRIEEHFDETFFAWIGRTDHDAAFYFRVHSPVLLLEFDNHVGALLANTEPEIFHVHTIIRTPNGNDYGLELIKQRYASLSD